MDRPINILRRVLLRNLRRMLRNLSGVCRILHCKTSCKIQNQEKCWPHPYYSNSTKRQRILPESLARGTMIAMMFLALRFYEEDIPTK
jgi:hypothetical protein